MTCGFPEVSHTQPLLIGVRARLVAGKARRNKPTPLIRIPCLSIPGVWHHNNTSITQSTTPERTRFLPQIPQALHLHQVRSNLRQDRKELGQEECIQLCLPLASPHKGKQIVLIVKPHMNSSHENHQNQGYYLRVYRTRLNFRGV